MKRQEFRTGKQADSLLGYQFGYINDTLLRIEFFRFSVIDKKYGSVTAYVSKKKIVAIDKKGDIFLPDPTVLANKSAELLDQAKVLVDSRNKSQ